MDEDDLSAARAPVTLRCSVTIDGRELYAVQEVPRAAWDDTAESVREVLLGMPRRALERIVLRETGQTIDAATVPVEPHVPTELEDQLYREMLASSDDS